jgi:hypothetical protein
MPRLLLCLVLAVALAGCQVPHRAVQQRPVTAANVALQPGDVAGFQKCSDSGNVDAVLRDERSQNFAAYDHNATEWAQWKQQGATDAYFAVYGRTSADCAAMSGGSTGAPQGGLMVGLVVKFKSEAVAGTNFRRESTLLGFGPKDIRFIELAGGRITLGTDTGLGPQSVVGSGLVAGTTYYIAIWQNMSFESDFIGYDVASADADTAVKNMNGRIH